MQLRGLANRMSTSLMIGMLIILMTSEVQAKVFSMSSESFAPYLRGTYTPASMTDGVYANALGANSTATTRISNDMSGELGVVYGSQFLNIRFGLEYMLLPRVQQNASDASTALYAIDSAATVFTPKLGFEINAKTWPTSRLFVLLEAGYANLASKTDYAFTVTGTGQYSLANFSESLKAAAPEGEFAAGFEGLLSDSTTYAFEAGYRYLNFTKMTYTSSGTNFSGAYSSGGTALNSDGTNRTLNLSNLFIGFSFRFWLR